jgi:beta-xylosidase
MKRNLLFNVLGVIILLCACNTQNNVSVESVNEELAENQFQNPVLGGDYPDPSIVRVGEDYYLTHSSFEYYPGLLVWHSTDMINWKRVGHALHKYVGSVWAPDLIYHNNKYYIYFPAGETNWVVTANSPEGPWSEPIDLKLPDFIDPGHVVDSEGKRYLYLSKGYIVALTDDGLATDGEPELVYEGWEFPKEWSTECFCLESPKSTIKNGYFYKIVAQGGTAGPATSHMVAVARAKSPMGPFENSPYNPVIHTKSRAERWWSQGHGTLVDDIEGNSWMIYHGYENGFHTLGRQSLLLPIEWTDDDWFRVPEGVNSNDFLTKPAGAKSADGTSLSDDFSGAELGLQWQFFKDYNTNRISVADGSLTLNSTGNSFVDSPPLLVNSSDRKYEVIVEYTIDENVTAGLTMFYNETGNARIDVNTENFSVYIQKNRKCSHKINSGNHGFLRILNDENEVSFYYSEDGTKWEKADRSLDMTGYNHNVFAEFLSLRAGLYAFGEGKVVFDNFIYNKLK